MPRVATLILLICVGVAGCSTAPSPPPAGLLASPVGQLPPASSKAATQTLALTDIRFSMDPLKPAFFVEGGLLCLSQGPALWADARRGLADEDSLATTLRRAFATELTKAGYRVVGDPELSFEAAQVGNAEILVAAKVKEIGGVLCFPNGGFGDFSSVSGWLFLDVDWEFFSQSRNVVAGNLTGRGSVNGGAHRMAIGDLFRDAATDTVRALVVQPAFDAMITREAVGPSTAITEG